MKKIFVVDDDEHVVSMVVEHLQLNGYMAVSAGDGKEALEKLRDDIPDLIVLDIVMPGMDGYTLIKELKAIESLRHIPVIILTAKDKMQDLFAIEGIKEYIVKPFDPDDLLNKIKSLLKSQG